MTNMNDDNERDIEIGGTVIESEVRPGQKNCRNKTMNGHGQQGRLIFKSNNHVTCSM